jgi:hypothetical protein
MQRKEHHNMRKIIIQERVNEPSDFSFRFVLWATVPAARQSQYADATKVSVVKDITAGELTSFRSGEFLEKQETAHYLAGTPIATIQADLIARFNTYQAQVTASNPWRFYGTSWDGTSWDVKQTT